MLTAPASLTTTGARTSRPSAMRTPTARPPSTITRSTSASTKMAPPARSMPGAMVRAIDAPPPTGKQAPRT